MVVVPLWRMGWLPVDGAISLNLHRLIMKLRKWQQQAISACVPKFVEGRQIFVIEACTGSGKSLCSAKAALEMMRRDAVDLVVVLTPNCGTRLGWKKTFERLDVDGRRVNVTDSTSFPRDTDVWVSTYAGYSKIEEALHDRPTVGIFAIIDEFHHPEDSADWGRAVDRLVALSDHAIFLSGTPWKREGKIAVLCGATNVENRPYYREDGRVEADFVYDYKDDLRQDPKTGTRGTVPVKFKFWESTWKSSDGQVVECLPKDLPAFPSDRFQNADEWYEWAKKCDMPLGKHLHFDADLESPLADDVGNKLLRNIVNESLSLLALSRKQIEIACGRKNQSVLLCVAKSMKEARKIAECIQEERPSLRVSIVLSDDNNGAKKLARIARQCRENAADKPDVIVSVGMISEGVDIPQIKVVAYMSAILTVLYFVQVIGRAIRRIPIDSKDQPYADRNHFDTIAYVVAPAHPKLRYIARNIERDVQDACGDAPSGHDDLSNDAQSDDKKKRTGVVTSGDESVGMFRGSDDFSGWHDVVEAIKMHERAADCYIDSHWAEHILGLFLRGDDGAKGYAESEIRGKCECLGISIDDIVNKVQKETEAVLSYEEEQKLLSERAMYWTNIIRFKVPKYRQVEDNDLAYRKVRGDVNRIAGLHKQGVSFTKASLEQKREWVRCAKEIAETAA
jgi:superfamily II DNA or RNA helicase